MHRTSEKLVNMIKKCTVLIASVHVHSRAADIAWRGNIVSRST
jgi:hypothetical protein